MTANWLSARIPAAEPYQGAPRFSARAAEIAAKNRPIPLMINRDAHPERRKTLHVGQSEVTEESAQKSAAD
jgi:hypothetical protein